MSALGNTKIDQNLDIGALLGGPVKETTCVESKNNPDGALKHNRSAKFSDQEIEQLLNIMIAIGTDKHSKALRWCLNKTWEVYGKEIERIAEEKKKIGVL
jgi:hypothetical protein